MSIRRRFSKYGPLLFALLVTVAALALYICWPLLFQQNDVESSQTLSNVVASQPQPIEVIRERGITCFAGLWFFAFGASIGSFLNVVAYRMPMGLTIVSKPSRCPYCETPIRFKHNVPIFGWIALRARCAACRLPISPRYVLIEILMGILFFVLFWRELASGGDNLPIESRARSGIMWNVLTPNWPLIGHYFYHGLLMGVLATIALMKWDRFRVPIRLISFSIVVPAVCKCLWPGLMVWPWWSPAINSLRQSRELEAAIHTFSGGLVGLLVGWAAYCLVESQLVNNGTASIHQKWICRCGLPVMGLIVGAFLGWQCVVPYLLFTAFLQFFFALVVKLVDRSADRLWPMSSVLATVLMICIWKQWPILGLPNEHSGVLAHWSWLVLSLATAYVATQIRPAFEK